MEEEKKKYIVYTDGGCSFNPGGTGGIGAVIIDQDTGEFQEISKGYLVTTNNRMEMTAVIEGLKATPENSIIDLYSDSQYVIRCMSGEWQKKKNRDLWNILDRISGNRSVHLHWVRGHNGNPNNERCDELATNGIMHGPYEEDQGYQEIKKAGREFYKKVDNHVEKNKKGAMSVNITVPKGVGIVPERFLHPREYEQKYGIKHSCAKAICEFYMVGRKTFKSYMALKTGGIDKYSRKKPEAIAAETDNPELYLNTIRQYFPDEKDVGAVARWNARGLSLDDSIRKVLVDAEVRENCIR